MLLWQLKIAPMLLLDVMAMQGAATGQTLSNALIAQIHTRKTKRACAEFASIKPALRSGVAVLMAMAKARGWRRGFVTSTEQANINAVMALDPYPSGGGRLERVGSERS
ncbi:MAG: hypothetical protein NBV68_04760 [Erythrobacter sp.]|uniref:hypothetical protein n=1 Tax=Erythrobacter sp. TaxID=1042 RepID=UPI0025F775F1|nr:hypothetical protein [Erythrobacter sp.]MCL9998668.1 hypothetical protein [Erythrobacter sp.]